MRCAECPPVTRNFEEVIVFFYSDGAPCGTIGLGCIIKHIWAPRYSYFSTNSLGRRLSGDTHTSLLVLYARRREIIPSSRRRTRHTRARTTDGREAARDYSDERRINSERAALLRHGLIIHNAAEKRGEKPKEGGRERWKEDGSATKRPNGQ